MKFNQYVEPETGLYIKLEEGENRIRIVSEAYIVWKAFPTGEKPKVFLLKASADAHNKTVQVDKEKAKEKALFYAINRKTGAIQIVEAGPQIMGKISTLARSTYYAFDSIPSYDLAITKKGTGMETEYDVLPSPIPTPLTQEEEDKIKNLESIEAIVSRDACDITHA